MSFKKFEDKDILLNTMRAYPSNEFIVFDSKVYWNSVPDQSGTKNDTVRNVPAGHVSLYEYNIDRQEVATGRSIGTGSIPDNGRIFPWIVTGKLFQ